MLWLLVYSSVTILHNSYVQPLHGRPVPHSSGTLDTNPASPVICDLPELALPQLALAVAAATSFHVQIINRIASGYPIWYLTVATWLTSRPLNNHVANQPNHGQWAVRAIIMYSLIQGTLFANFLPPA